MPKAKVKAEPKVEPKAPKVAKSSETFSEWQTRKNTLPVLPDVKEIVR